MRRAGKVRGAQSASQRMRDAHRLHREQGVPVATLDARYGVVDGTVRKWLGDVEQALADERNVAKLRWTG